MLIAKIEVLKGTAGNNIKESAAVLTDQVGNNLPVDTRNGDMHRYKNNHEHRKGILRRKSTSFRHFLKQITPESLYLPPAAVAFSAAVLLKP